jgi:hypothetical protein
VSVNAPGTTRHHAAALIASLVGAGGVWLILSSGGVIGWLLAGFLLLAVRFLFAPRSGELALLAKCLAAFVALAAIFVAGVFVVLESGEVVVLRHRDERGSSVEDRLWVVDLDGLPSVTTGSDTHRVSLIRASPHVELVRGRAVECRRATIVPAGSATSEGRRAAERLFREKYGYRLYASEALRKLLGGPGAEPVLIRLEPCDETA